MKTSFQVLVDHFGSGDRKVAAAALGYVDETFRLWQHNGIPWASAIEIEKRSKGVVTAERILREHKRREARQQQPAAA